jgi:hypothetical protein
MANESIHQSFDQLWVIFCRIISNTCRGVKLRPVLEEATIVSKSVQGSMPGQRVKRRTNIGLHWIRVCEIVKPGDVGDLLFLV